MEKRKKVRRKRKKRKTKHERKKIIRAKQNWKEETWRGEKIRRKEKGNRTWIEIKIIRAKKNTERKNETEMDAAPGLSWNLVIKRRVETIGCLLYGYSIRLGQFLYLLSFSFWISIWSLCLFNLSRIGSIYLE